MARFFYPQYTVEEIGKIVEDSPGWRESTLTHHRPPFYEGLAGRTLTLTMDEGGPVHYVFADAHTLTWRRRPGGQPRQEYYEALEVDEGIVLLVHILRGTLPQQAWLSVLDFPAGLVTTFFCQIGNDISTREVDRDIVFGVIEGGPAAAARHSLTTELVGRSILWNYTPNFSIQHIYASQYYSVFADINTFYGCMLLGSPCNYVKISDHVYIYSWVETEGAGIQGFALMNLHRMHDVGCFFGINGGGRFECCTFGAKGRCVGQLTNFDVPYDLRPNYGGAKA